FGWSRREAIGRKLAETIVPPAYREAHQRGLERFLATGEGPVLGRRLELSALHWDGHEFPIELTISPLEVGGKQLFNSFVHDTSERKAAEKALEYERHLLHTLMDNVPDSIYFKDSASRFLRINQGLARVLGLSDPADAVGKTDFDFFSEEHARSAFNDEQEV